MPVPNTHINPTILVPQDVFKVMNWLEQVYQRSIDGDDILLHFLSLMAYNCLSGTWAEEFPDTETYHVHEADPYWKADLDWFGQELVHHIRVGPQGEMFVDMKLMQEVFGFFSKVLFTRFFALSKRVNMAVAYESPNDNHDLDLLVKLQIFHPARHILGENAVNVESIINSLDLTLNYATRLDTFSRRSPAWSVEQELGGCVIATMASALVYLQERFDA